MTGDTRVLMNAQSPMLHLSVLHQTLISIINHFVFIGLQYNVTTMDVTYISGLFDRLTRMVVVKSFSYGS